MLQFSASFVGSNAVRPVGQAQAETVFNYCVGDPGNWREDEVRYDGIGGLSLSGDGALLVDLGGDRGHLIDDAPYIYQDLSGPTQVP